MRGTYEGIEKNLGAGPYSFVSCYDKDSVGFISRADIVLGENFKGRCEHCGQPLIYLVTIENGDGQLFTIGSDCASRALSGPGIDRVIKQIRASVLQLAKQRRYKRAVARREIANAASFESLRHTDPLLYEALNTEHDVLKDMKARWISYGPLSDNACNYAKKILEDIKNPPAPNTPVKTGRRMIEGKIVSTKLRETMYGVVRKALIVTHDNEKVWGNLPSVWLDRDDLVGKEVKFKATVETGDDPLFGFFKRPANPYIVE